MTCPVCGAPIRITDERGGFALPVCPGCGYKPTPDDLRTMAYAALEALDLPTGDPSAEAAQLITETLRQPAKVYRQRR